MLSVLLVGPEVAGWQTLSVTTELLRIGDLRDVRLTALVGPEVTAQRVLDRLERERHDAMIWSGHGEAARLLLSDGRHVSPNWLAIQLLRRGVRLAVLATCLSAARPEQTTLALGFQDVLPARGVSVVAMSVEVSDRAAVEYNVALMQALVAGSDLRKAHEAGLEAAAWAGDARAPQLFVTDYMDINNMDYPRYDNQLLHSMSDKIDKVGEQVSDIKTRQAVLEGDVRRLMLDVQDLRAEVVELRRSTRVYLVLLAAITLVALAALMWSSLV